MQCARSAADTGSNNYFVCSQIIKSNKCVRLRCHVPEKNSGTGAAFFIHAVNWSSLAASSPESWKKCCHILLSSQAAMLFLALRPTPARVCVTCMILKKPFTSEVRSRVAMAHWGNCNCSATWNWQKCFCWNACPHKGIKNRISFRCWGKWQPQHCCATVSCYQHISRCCQLFSSYTGRVQNTFYCPIMHCVTIIQGGSNTNKLI